METWVPVVATFITTLVASSGFWTYLMHKSIRSSANTKLLKGLAFGKITSLGTQYIERGWITRDEYDDFEKYLFIPYKKYGGNGTAERIMNAIRELPLKSYSQDSRIMIHELPKGE